MILFWSIKSAFDLAKYGLGGSKTFRGTGVFSGFILPKDDQPEKIPLDSTPEMNKNNGKDAKATESSANEK